MRAIIVVLTFVALLAVALVARPLVSRGLVAVADRASDAGYLDAASLALDASDVVDGSK